MAFLLKEEWENLEWLVKGSNKLVLRIRKPFFAAEMVNLSGEGVSHAKLWWIYGSSMRRSKEHEEMN